MRSKKNLGILLIGLGTAMLIAALVLVLTGTFQKAQSKKEVEQVMAVLQAEVTQTEPPEGAFRITGDPQATGETTEPTLATDPTDPITLTSELLDGHEYVGYLSFPSLDRELPIMKIKYLEDLQIAPCLEKGSPHTDDAVICAHNYPSHFGPIRDWVGGEEVIFTDLQDNVIRYTVAAVETISPYDVDKVMNSEHDLVLYTCTPGGAQRVMVACDRAET